MVLGFNATVSVVEKFVTSSDGVEIFAQAAGNSHLPALVFIHGLALSALVWVKILQDANLLKSFHLVGGSVYPLVVHGLTSFDSRWRTTCAGMAEAASLIPFLGTAPSCMHKTLPRF